MKNRLSLLIMLIICSAEAGTVVPGDSREKVLAHLGDPKGSVAMDGVEWMLYPQGKIWLQDGVVTRASLLSAEEFADKLMKDEQARIEETIRREAERAERIQNGTRLRDRLLESPDLYLKSSREQLSMWQRFRRDYPEVDVSEHYLGALEAVRLEQERNDQDRRIRELEARVREAEFRTQEAQQEAAERSSFRRSRYAFSYPVVYTSSHWACPQDPKPSCHRRRGADVKSSCRTSGSTLSGTSVTGSVGFRSGHVAMKPITFGHVKFSL